MWKIFLLMFSSVAFMNAVHAQDINMYKTFGGIRFERDSTAISLRQVMEILHENPVAFEEIKKAKFNYNMAGILGFSGGLLIGLPLGTALVGGKPEWNLAIGGGALLLASIPFNRVFKARALNALDIYNGKVTSNRIKPEFYFAGTGAKLIIKF